MTGQEILEEQREHSAIIAAWGRGEAPKVREDYSGRVYTVCGSSRWDEGLCVCDDRTVFMLRTRFTLIPGQLAACSRHDPST